MLTLKALTAGESGGYYLQSLPDCPADYYLDGGLAGRWLGASAGRLALSGPVDADQFRRVLAGAHPGSGESRGLGVRRRGDRQLPAALAHHRPRTARPPARPSRLGPPLPPRLGPA